jgi:dGTP triphosphohydrolase
MKNKKMIDGLTNFYNALNDSQELKDLFFKTQILNKAVDNPELKLTNRGIHSMQVSETAGRISMNCGLEESDFYKSKIIGLGHDLGHTPIGHAGEASINTFVKSKGDYKFNHAEYSGIVFKSFVDNYKEKQRYNIQKSLDKGYKKYAEFYQNNIDVIESVQDELIKGIQNHSNYYNHLIDSSKETNPQTCGRLADSMSFMASDLSDIMRANNEIESKKKIVEDKDINELKKMLANTDSYDEKKIDEVVGILRNENQIGISKIQMNIADEVKNLSTDKEINGISDTYKYTREIDYLYRNDKNVAFKVLEFDKYAKEYLSGYKSLDKETRALFEYKSMKELPMNFRGKDYNDKLIEKSNNYKKVCSNPKIIGDNNKEVLEYKDKLVYEDLNKVPHKI